MLRLLRQARNAICGPLHDAGLRRRVAGGGAPALVPFYHRVADHTSNPWTISRKEFARHLDYCRDRLTPASLDVIQATMESGRNDRCLLNITFDDGYAENCDFAIPLLIERHVCCTYFVTVNHIVHQRPFPHDQQNGAPLAVNTVRQLREMADHGVQIGLHARDHVDFATLTAPDQIDQQIRQGKDELEQLIGHPVRHFAFPFGMPAQLTRAAIAGVRRAGLASFCSAFGGYNLPGRDAFHLRRFHGDPEFSRFQNWVRFDPRKLRREPPVPYDTPDPTRRSSGAPECDRLACEASATNAAESDRPHVGAPQ
ncbi:polysaccharide deacetylase family protein [Roseiconus nitratireducens]|uniref:Polysaccharide deacetylase family protein n=1 Tax=Roseiconus nitratireducens TaxID=2605748 RepID=A0A5M6DFV6_9BACT|nr:polysaccharide deacetylase family protein [Roseiconus nitratireducens]KAA5545162.1 polysaccharide deacetylase family protein [Roseiconus nitratireducens]